LAKIRADDNDLRLQTLAKIQSFANEHPEVEIFSYHDINELL
jgi:hypothetical protein